MAIRQPQESEMKIKKAVVWSLMNPDGWHPSVTADERKINALMPLLSTLFPGIEYYSITGFTTVMCNYVRPVLNKFFPEIIGVSAEHIPPDEMIDIGAFQASKGYQWQNSTEWQKEFEQKLAT